MCVNIVPVYSIFTLRKAEKIFLVGMMNIIFEPLTGTGKTRVVIEALKNLAFNKRLKRFLLVVPKRVMTINP